jgi:uncharacterized CHY-type Zn-finger protein
VPATFVRGVGVDAESRCAHYGSDRDVVALRFGCCGTYYACLECHAELAGHDAEPWPTTRRGEPAARCGVCGAVMSGDTYVAADVCPDCGAAFNPGCRTHYHRYFEWIDGSDPRDG